MTTTTDGPTIDDLVRVARHGDAAAVLAAVVRSVRRVVGTEVAFGAVGDGRGGYEIGLTERLRDPRWIGQQVRAGQGLGGLVLRGRTPRLSHDYVRDGSISDDFRPIVAAEGLRAVACVPLPGRTGPEGLVWIADRRAGTIEDRAVERLREAVDVAAGSLAIARMEETVRGLAGATRAGLAECASRRLGRYAAPDPDDGPSVRLTPREHDVLDLLCAGRSNDAIARELCISPATAKGHVANLLAKFGATSRLEVATNAWRAR